MSLGSSASLYKYLLYIFHLIINYSVISLVFRVTRKYVYFSLKYFKLISKYSTPKIDFNINTQTS